MVHFEYSSLIEAPVETVFAFHEKPEAFETMAPPRRRIEILRREGGIEEGGEIEFRMRVGLFWVRWRARHTGYEKNRRFADEQVRGPFRYWRHEHRFEPDGGGTRLTDSIRFSLPGGAPADWLLGWLARLELRRYFRFRHEVTRRIAERMRRRGEGRL